MAPTPTCTSTAWAMCRSRCPEGARLLCVCVCVHMYMFLCRVEGHRRELEPPGCQVRRDYRCYRCSWADGSCVSMRICRGGRVLVPCLCCAA